MIVEYKHKEQGKVHKTRKVKRMLDLTKKFYELLDEGIIYDTDENGQGMSYSEYAEIMNYGRNLIKEELDGITDRLEWLNRLDDIIHTADDDTRMFFGIDEDMGYIYIDEDDLDNSEVNGIFKEWYNNTEFN